MLIYCGKHKYHKEKQRNSIRRYYKGCTRKIAEKNKQSCVERFFTNHNIKICNGYVVITAVVMRSFIFWEITPCSPLKITEQALLAACFMLVSCLDISSTMKIVAICSYETADYFQHTIRRYIPEDRTLHVLNHLKMWQSSNIPGTAPRY
jgi:hypothetical protein